MRKQDVRDAKKRSDIIAWYERIFFSERTGRRQPGCLRLLNERVERIRGAKTQLGSDIRVYPVIVSYDSWAEGPALYKWLNERCGELNLLQQSNSQDQPSFSAVGSKR